MNKKILITGAAGFIGHHIVNHILKKTDNELIFLDRLDLSGNQMRLVEVNCMGEGFRDRCRFFYHDIRAELNELLIKQIGAVDIIIHTAAGTHVDRSIDDPMSFVLDNVVGTTNLLEYAKKINVEKFLYFSTDEVFGPAPHGTAYKEWDRYNSGNPYAATKAGAEELCLAYANTYKLPVVITHTMNVFGERQHPEKFIPMLVSKITKDQLVTIHADKTRQHAGSRFYIHAENVANAVMFVLEHAKAGDKYNIVGEKEVDNLSLAHFVAQVVGHDLKYEMVDFHSSRPGHDLRYALDGSKLARMGWFPPMKFEESLKRTVQWTWDNQRWLI